MSKPLQRGVVLRLNWREIEPFKDQPRKHFSAVSIENLAASIKEERQRDPISITPAYDKLKGAAKYRIINGERRWRACRHLDCDIDCIVTSVKNTQEHYLAAATANFHREDHTPMEIARVVHRLLHEYKMKWPEINRHVGMTEVTVRKYLALMDLPFELQKKFEPETPRDQRFPLAVAQELSRLPHEEQLNLIGKVRKKRSAEAIQIIRRKAAEVEAGGGVVIQGKRGRKRRPSDDFDMINVRINRVIADMGFIIDHEPDVVKKALVGRSLDKNTELHSQLSLICRRASELRAHVSSSFPEDFKKRLPKEVR